MSVGCSGLREKIEELSGNFIKNVLIVFSLKLWQKRNRFLCLNGGNKDGRAFR